jgi:hypothetical protein
MHLWSLQLLTVGDVLEVTRLAVYDIMHMILVDRAGRTFHTRSVLKHAQGFTPDIIVAGRMSQTSHIRTSARK